MQTQIAKLADGNRDEVLESASQIIKKGGLVVFPTETVYGLGADASNEEAIKKIFIAKGRPTDNPLIVHISSKKDLRNLVKNVPTVAERLMDVFWPGPLTFILEKQDKISSLLSGGLDTLAVRVPEDSFARSFIEKCGVAIAAPSANMSGKPSGTKIEDIEKELDGKVDMIIDDGQSDIGVESTVVKVGNNQVLILRSGAITEEMLKEAVPEAHVFWATKQSDLGASPGTRYRHYAPNARVEIFNSEEELNKRKKDLERENKKVFTLGWQGEEEALKNLYSDLRQADRERADVVLVKAFPEKGLGITIMDRLKKASNS